jgi:hypothetical protein
MRALVADSLRCIPVLGFFAANDGDVILSRRIEGLLYGSPPSIQCAASGEFNGRYRAGISAI